MRMSRWKPRVRVRLGFGESALAASGTPAVRRRPPPRVQVGMTAAEQLERLPAGTRGRMRRLFGALEGEGWRTAHGMRVGGTLGAWLARDGDAGVAMHCSGSLTIVTACFSVSAFARRLAAVEGVGWFAPDAPERPRLDPAKPVRNPLRLNPAWRAALNEALGGQAGGAAIRAMGATSPLAVRAVLRKFVR